MDKLCKNCIYFKRDYPIEFSQCSHRLGTINDRDSSWLIDGKTRSERGGYKPRTHFCSNMRQFNHLCGKEGSLWDGISETYTYTFTASIQCEPWDEPEEGIMGRLISYVRRCFNGQA